MAWAPEQDRPMLYGVHSPRRWVSIYDAPASLPLRRFRASSQDYLCHYSLTRSWRSHRTRACLEFDLGWVTVSQRLGSHLLAYLRCVFGPQNQPFQSRTAVLRCRTSRSPACHFCSLVDHLKLSRCDVIGRDHIRINRCWIQGYCRLMEPTAS
ncbi:hypothetical protein BC834DRAFT_302965 [Gloeopeniophorella convolvens]|nr:hypothetical protein BC834DRAFT_302965 [Gloeopeniophorella convolvens]